MNTIRLHSGLWEKAVRAVIPALVLVLAAAPALAQETVDENVNRIEVRDGKVYVNGEMVKELENKDARIRFSRDGEDDFVFLSDDGPVMRRRFDIARPRLLDEEDNELFNGEDNELLSGWTARAFSNAGDNYRMALDLEPLREDMMMLRMGPDGQAFFGGENSREIVRMERKSRDLATKLRRAEGDEREELNKELEAVLDQIFDLKLEAQRERVENLSAELEKLRSRVEERESARADIIAKRLRDLRGERDRLDW